MTTDFKFTITTFILPYLTLVLEHDELPTGIEHMMDVIRFGSLVPAPHLWLSVALSWPHIIKER